MIALIDYDAGNMRSAEKAFRFLGCEIEITRDAHKIREADKIVLPGVGAFGAAMKRLEEYRLLEPIDEAVRSGKPFLGICLGAQLLFEESQENEGIKGLGYLKGNVLRIPDTGLKVPHIGWNSLAMHTKSCLFDNIADGSYVYFIHSYYISAKNEKDVIASTEYGITIHAAVQHENVYGCQFHPEKSGDVGLKLLKNFVELH